MDLIKGTQLKEKREKKSKESRPPPCRIWTHDLLIAGLRSMYSTFELQPLSSLMADETGRQVLALHISCLSCGLIYWTVITFQDSVVFPKDSAFFEFYSPGNDTVILPLRESPIYLEDWIGLKHLDELGRLVFIEVGGGHIEYETHW